MFLNQRKLALFFFFISPSYLFPLETVSLQLKWKHQFQFAGYYVAQEKGYYREAGLDVRFIEGGPERDAVPTVTAGEAEYGISNSELLLHRHRGEPVVALASIFQHSPLALIVRRDTGIRSALDLPGHRLMIGPDAAELSAYFKLSRINESDFRLVPHSQNLDDLVNGRVDGMTIYTTNQPFSLLQQGVNFVLIRAIDGGVDFYGDTLFTTESEIQNHRNRAEAFRAASIRGWSFAMEHTSETAEMIHAKYAPGKSLEHLIWEGEHYQRLIVPDLVEVGHMSPQRWRRISDVYARLGMLPPGYDFSGMLFDPGRGSLRAYWQAIGAGLILILLLAALSIYALRSRETVKRTYSRFRALIENAPDGIALLVPRGTDELRFSYMSPAGSRMFGYLEEEVLALDPETLTHPEDRPYVLPAVQDSMNRPGSITRLEYRYRHKDGSWRWVESTISNLFQEPGVEAMVFNFRDITERRQAEEKLAKAVVAAEAANRAKSAFLASMSHEFRTPLNAIIGFAQLLEMGSPSPLSLEQKEAVEHISDSGRHLLSLINQLLDLARIESGSIDLRLTSVSVADMYREVTAILSSAARSQGVEIRACECKDLPENDQTDSYFCRRKAYVQADPDRIRQVLINLVSNAVKYNNPGGRVVLSCQFEGEIVRLAVTDNGPGISPSESAGIFQPFQRLGAEKTGVPGTGIGLAISRQLVEAMGGSIGFESKPGQGSTFWIELPVAASPVQSEDKLRSGTPNARAAGKITGRILYIEDDPTSASLMEHIIRRLQGVELTLAEDAEKGLALIEQNPPDLILTDLDLPGMKGLEAMQFLKTKQRTSLIPVVAVSASAMNSEIEAGIQAGFHAYITKPFRIAELLALVEDILRKKTRRPR